MIKPLIILTIFAFVSAFGELAPAKGAGDMKPKEIENKGIVKPPSDITLDLCELARTNGHGISANGMIPGVRIVTYFDPIDCPGAPTYPFEITALSFTLYDYWNTDPWPYAVDIVVYNMLEPGDPCQGPGAELCRFSVSCDQASFEWPGVGTAVFPEACSVNGPFFIGLHYTDPNPDPPTPLLDNLVPPCCDIWFSVESSWGDWCTFGDPPPFGYPLFWVGGATPQTTGACCWSDGTCTTEVQEDCENNGGTFYAGQACEDTDCLVEDIPTLSEWGRLLMALLLLALGSAAVIRRRRSEIQITR